MAEVSSQRGFTLVEVLVVTFIIALLATLVGIRVFGQLEGAKRKNAKIQVESIEDAIKIFRLDTGRLPSPGEGLQVLIPPPPSGVRNYNSDGYLDDEKVPEDPWGHPYTYETDGMRFRIISHGPDGMPSEDDITS